MLAYTAVPVWSISEVKELLVKLADVSLRVPLLVHGFVYETFHIIFHFLVHFTDNPLDATLRHFKLVLSLKNYL